MRSTPGTSPAPVSLDETMARPPTREPEGAAGDLGATFVRPPQALGETMARDVTTVSAGSLQATIHERLAAADDPDDPIRIGRFTVLRMLGEGGMGVVYAAYDIELDRKVAIKLVRETATEGTQGHASMLREAQAMAKLSHPNVVQIYEVGEYDEQVFVAMEFVKGRTLTAWLSESPRPWQDIRAMFVQAGHGLAAAHAEGLVHRDFKPDNVLIGEDERARVADFGLAGVETRRHDRLDDSMRVRLARLQSLDAELTVAGAIQGTPAYMAPEQHLGGATDERSDLFSFCVALWEALYGERPFPGDTLESLADAVTNGRLRARPPATTVPEWLHTALVAGLATAPEQRPAAMAGLLQDLTFDLRQPIRSRAWMWSAGFGVASLITAAAVYIGTREREPTADELAAIAALSHEARGAAEVRRWIYPDPAAPDNTAILRLVALEATQGPPAAPARAEATALRSEFAATLVNLGDHYWDVDGGKPFARDFYVQGMIFEPTHPRARDRSGLTAGQFADLEAKATSGGFTPADIIAAEPLAILADSDTSLRKARLAAFQARHDHGTAVQKTLLGPLLGQPAPGPDQDQDPTVIADAADPRRGPGEVSAADLVAAATAGELTPQGEPASADPSIDPTIDPAIDPAADPAIGPAPPPVDPTPRPKPRRVRTSLKVLPPGVPQPSRPEQTAESLARADKLVALGEAARARGDLDAAEPLFHQALAEFSASVDALVGLCDVHFDRGQFDQAVAYAERAVVVAPADPTARMRLGDSYVKLLRYLEARAQYERARELAHPQAESRLQKLKAKLGG